VALTKPTDAETINHPKIKFIQIKMIYDSMLSYISREKKDLFKKKWTGRQFLISETAAYQEI
jgi:hypothetical protein